MNHFMLEKKNKKQTNKQTKSHTIISCDYITEFSLVKFPQGHVSALALEVDG